MKTNRTIRCLLIGIFMCALGIVMFFGAISMTPVHDRQYILAIGEYHASPTAENKCNYLEQYIRKTKTEVNIRYGLLFAAGMLIGMGVMMVFLRRGEPTQEGEVGCHIRLSSEKSIGGAPNEPVPGMES